MKLRIHTERRVALIFWIIVMAFNIKGIDCHRTRSRDLNSTEPIVAEVGKKVTLICSPDSTSAPNITWYKNNETLTPSSRIGIKQSSFVLEINPVKPEDVGFYNCDADDGANITSYPLGELIVLRKAKPNHWLAAGLFFIGGLLVSAVFASLRFIRLRQSHYPFSYKQLCAVNLCECYKKKRRVYHLTII